MSPDTTGTVRRRGQNDDNSLSCRLFQIYQDWAFWPLADFVLITVLLAAECALGWLIIAKVPYTEIDWEAYMQEVEAFVVDGELDYRNIRGGTGPLVYPAGFLYLFAALRSLTENGVNIRMGQCLFLGFYVATQATVLLIYQMALQCYRSRQQKLWNDDDDDKSKSSNSKNDNKVRNKTAAAHTIWCWRILMGVLCLSKRLHSIFMLRLFNDGPTMLFLYMSMLLFMKQRWSLGCFVFSLAVSLKMNVLLFAPGLLLLLLQSSPDMWTVVFHRLFAMCALPQLILGAPFLATFPVSYLRKAFELDRVFFFKWTVNFKFLPEDWFVSKQWALVLLSGHLGGLLYLFCWKWIWQTKASTHNNKSILLFEKAPQAAKQPSRHLSPDYVAYTMMVSNFVGIAFARTLHYQFYCWYFHAVPFLAFFPTINQSTPTNPFGRFILTLAVVAALEGAFLTFPATPTSSIVLQLAHGLVLFGIQPPKAVVVESETERDQVKVKKDN